MEVKKPGCREGSATRSGGRAIPPKHRRGGVKYDPPPFTADLSNYCSKPLWKATKCRQNSGMTFHINMEFIDTII